MGRWFSRAISWARRTFLQVRGTRPGLDRGVVGDHHDVTPVDRADPTTTPRTAPRVLRVEAVGHQRPSSRNGAPGSHRAAPARGRSSCPGSAACPGPWRRRPAGDLLLAPQPLHLARQCAARRSNASFRFSLLSRIALISSRLCRPLRPRRIIRAGPKGGDGTIRYADSSRCLRKRCRCPRGGRAGARPRSGSRVADLRTRLEREHPGLTPSGRASPWRSTVSSSGRRPSSPPGRGRPPAAGLRGAPGAADAAERVRTALVEGAIEVDR